jgi:uncharacterized protein
MSKLSVSQAESQATWRQRCLSQAGIPAKVDLTRLARSGTALFGSFPVTKLKRLVEDLPSQAAISAEPGVNDKGIVWFEVSGSTQTGRRDRITLEVQSVLALTCQRCLQTMWLEIDEKVEFELYTSESQMRSALDGEEMEPHAPEPLLVLQPIDLFELIEDQLILAVPYVPKHEDCQPAKSEAGDPIEPVKRQSPFEVLGKLKRNPPQ